ncbi:MAG: hypothetical protein A3B44_01295 [Candidatus Levybacteria bacterium RIFCSPLOWO2_01_FULL_38_21]|nr:MAG: hypothetical protein A3B44_01295 [Candidatus Levybacteria bacterium RIFCSPLOWO2_01_FULL_38_21]
MVKYVGLSTLEVLEEAKNYNKWISDEILKYVSTPVLEIGAGIGNLTSYFLIKKPLYVTDVDNGLVSNLRNKFKNNKDVFIEILDITKDPPKKYHSFFSTIFGINVLEHINNDEQALRNIYKMLRNNGRLILLVPAKKIAYTKLDKELGHFRRYEKREIIKKLRKNGYKEDKIYFFNLVGLLSWIIRDKIKRNNINLKPYHIKFFDKIVPILRIIESFIHAPVGISLIVVAHKKN